MVKANDILSDNQSFLQTSSGLLARKGSIAATILNAHSLEALLKEPESTERQVQIEGVLEDIRALLPTLHAVNLFQFFTPFEWLQEGSSFQEGRSLVALLYLQHYPQLIDALLINHLQNLLPHVSTITQKEINKILTTHLHPYEV